MNDMTYTRHLVLSILIILITLSISDAQTRWQKRFDLGEDEPVSNAIPTPDGGYIITGSTGLSTFRDIFLIKTDQDGDTQWIKTYEMADGGSGGRKVINTQDGGYMVLADNVDGDQTAVLLKLDAFGNEQWMQQYIDQATLGGASDIIQTADGGYAFLSSHFQLDAAGEFTGSRDKYLYRVDSQGNLLWVHQSGTALSDFANSLVENTDGSFTFTGSYVDGSGGWSYNIHLTTVDASGNELWTQVYDNGQTTGPSSSEGADDLIRTSDGGYLIIGNTSQSNNRSFYIIKTDATGVSQWTKQLYSEQNATYASGGSETSDGNFVIMGRRDFSTTMIVKLSATTGDIIWERSIKDLTAGLSIEETQDQGLIICGEWVDESTGYEVENNIALIKMDGDGLFLPKGLEGNIFQDVNASCTYNNGETELEDVLVQVMDDNGDIFFTNTDAQGNYFFSLDTGDYVVTAFPPSPFYDLCQPTYPVSLSNPLVFDSTNLDIPMEVLAYCPYLEVDVSAWALRECFDNIYYVNYCNLGTIDAVDASVELSLQSPLYISASNIPFTGPDNDGIYTFEVGTVPFGDCGGFNVTVNFPCDTTNVGEYLGQTLCVDAHIFPDSLCGDISPLWDGSSIEIKGECETDSVRFRIRNIGSGDMQMPRSFFVIEDQIMFVEEDFQLNAGQSIEVAYVANGSTYRMEAEQAEDHPGMSNPSVALEGCGDMPFSLGFINQFAQDDRDPFLSSECREVTGSYDPNDKQGFPRGYGDEHYIEKNTDIEYLIRFQNTGTDTAFTVVIRDEISDLFDLSTLRPGASSHPYDYQVFDRMVKFTFNDILLVDSTTNEPASHGFVKFRISQIADLPNGTILENTAGIYFDFNPPIITNTSFHTIGEDFVEVNLVSNLPEEMQLESIKAYPNPFSEVINFEIDGVFEEIILNVYDAQGREVFQSIHHESIFQFHRKELNAGMYFYTLSSDGINIAKGKMLLH